MVIAFKFVSFRVFGIKPGKPGFKYMSSKIIIIVRTKKYLKSLKSFYIQQKMVIQLKIPESRKKSKVFNNFIHTFKSLKF